MKEDILKLEQYILQGTKREVCGRYLQSAVGSNPTGPTITEPGTGGSRLLEYGLWPFLGNRESTVKRKLRTIKSLSGSPQDMMFQVQASCRITA